MDSLRKLPLLGGLVKFSENSPRIAAWVVLAAGIIILLAIEARDVGLLPGQWLMLFLASTLVAGLCIWIVSWEDTEPPTDSPNTAADSDERTKP
jgi:hypothetical protein